MRPTHHSYQGQSYKGLYPQLGQNTFIAPGVQIIGNVVCGQQVNIWFNAVVRGDVNKIVIGEETNIQDLSLLHVTKEFPCLVGPRVSVAHSVLLHGCIVGAECLIGMGAIIMDGVEVGEKCLVAAGSLLPPGKKYPPGSMIMGRPGVVVRPLNTEELEMVKTHYQRYLRYAKEYRDEAKS